MSLVYCLKHFRCFLEGASLEVFTYNQILNCFFTKPNLSRKEVRWLELFGQFGITKMSLRPARIHVLSDMLSRAPHVISGKLEVGNFEASVVTINLDFKNYLEDQLFSPMWRSLTGERCKDFIESNRMIRLLPYFCVKADLLYYKDRVCVPGKCVPKLLNLAHD